MTSPSELGADISIRLFIWPVVRGADALETEGSFHTLRDRILQAFRFATLSAQANALMHSIRLSGRVRSGGDRMESGHGTRRVSLVALHR